MDSCWNSCHSSRIYCIKLLRCLQVKVAVAGIGLSFVVSNQEIIYARASGLDLRFTDSTIRNTLEVGIQNVQVSFVICLPVVSRLWIGIQLILSSQVAFVLSHPELWTEKRSNLKLDDTDDHKSILTKRRGKTHQVQLRQSSACILKIAVLIMQWSLDLKWLDRYLRQLSRLILNIFSVECKKFAVFTANMIINSVRPTWWKKPTFMV